MTDHDPRFMDAAAVYLLGALEPAEAEAFEAHLDDCEACRSELAHLKLAADALPVSVPQHAAPPALKGRLMAIVESEAALLHATSPDADRVRTPEPAKPRRRWLPEWLGRPGMALAATVLVLIAGGVGGIVVSGGGSSTRTVVAQTAPNGSEVKLLLRNGETHSTLTADGLPDAGSGRVYQVWLRKGEGAPQPTNALFSVNKSGSASVDVPGSLKDVDDVLVTSEPDGGSAAPTRPPVITVRTT